MRAREFLKLAADPLEVLGDVDTEFETLDAFDASTPNRITYLTALKFRLVAPNLEANGISVLITEPSIVDEILYLNIPCIIVVENARLFFSKFVDYYFNHAPLRQSFVSTIHHSTFVHQSALIESSVVIGANCYISSGVVIKSGTRIHDNVKIGENSVVGKDGFGFVIQEDSVPKRFRHIGGVSINSGVEIGALTCIDRGTLSDTYIGENTKIDNLVHIAHNVKIGSESLIMASVTLCGSAVNRK